jgi:hypothetical protein
MRGFKLYTLWQRFALEMNVIKFCGCVSIIHVVLFLPGSKYYGGTGFRGDGFVTKKSLAFLGYIENQPIVTPTRAVDLSFGFCENMTAADKLYSRQGFFPLGITVEYHIKSSFSNISKVFGNF